MLYSVGTASPIKLATGIDHLTQKKNLQKVDNLPAFFFNPSLSTFGWFVKISTAVPGPNG
jgi:hypothetical protein